MTHLAPPRPFTPDTLAARWGCSSETIRQMIKAGRLPCFRAGRRLFRIPAAAVEEFEQCQTSASAVSGAASASTGSTPEEHGDVISLRHATERQPKDWTSGATRQSDKSVEQ
jgi:excisionase family DNA binding protein